MKLYSWNVNGLRACEKKGFSSWVQKNQGDIYLLQETRLSEDNLSDLGEIFPDYRCHLFPAQKKGYSGVALLVHKRKVESSYEIVEGLGIEEFDREGRVISMVLGDLLIISSYFPNSQHGLLRLDYKLDFCNSLFRWVRKKMQQGKKVVIGGDINIAHKEIDLANPKTNHQNPGFYIDERKWMDKIVKSGFIDSFRHFHADREKCYTWWSQRKGVRERNVGWRIDYFIVSNDLEKNLVEASIYPEVMGSDHCPIGIRLELE